MKGMFIYEIQSKARMMASTHAEWLALVGPIIGQE